MAEKYYALSEEEMQSLLKDAKKGVERAQNELLKIFDNYLRKYVALLYFGKYDLKNYDIRTFIVLFVADPALRAGLKHQKMAAPGYKAVAEIVRGVQYMAHRYGDVEDIEQTVKMAFLHCVNTYERRGEIPFSGYLYSYYRYILKRFVDMFLIDQLGRKTFPLLADSDIYGEEGEDDQVGFPAPPTPALEAMLGAEKIDEFWVAGDTCYPPFDILSVQERQLLKWRYEDQYKASEIAVRITEHQNTLREHFARIRHRLKEAISQDLDLTSL